jgi:hypothetical protein
MPEKPIILFGAGMIGRTAFYCFKPERIFCFADTYNHGREFLGKKVISFEELLEIHGDYDVLVSAGLARREEILKQCRSKGVDARLYYDAVRLEDLEPNPDIEKLKNIHKGKRCFVIGNGPSLTAADLDVLKNHNEICFASNYIVRIYPQTRWRPDYYAVVDFFYLINDFELIRRTEAKTVILPKIEQFWEGEIDDAKSLLKQAAERGSAIVTPTVLLFAGYSEDVSRAFNCFGTVTFAHLQFAAYMGFERIYLLGCDCTVGNWRDPDEFREQKSHFYQEDDVTVDIMKAAFQKSRIEPDTSVRLMNADYTVAEEYSRAHRFRIYNATRGGELEVFERVDFDDLF